MPQHAAAPRILLFVFMVIHTCLPALFVLFALETFCLICVSSILYSFFGSDQDELA